jgi:hypothetical protein
MITADDAEMDDLGNEMEQSYRDRREAQLLALMEARGW